MTTSQDPTNRAASRTPKRRITTVYDRLDDARMRRERALSQKPQAAAKPVAPSPKSAEAEEGSAGLTAVVSSLKASAARAETGETPVAAPEPTARPEAGPRRKRLAALVAVPALVGLAAVALPLTVSERPFGGESAAAVSSVVEDAAPVTETAAAAPGATPAVEEPTEQARASASAPDTLADGTPPTVLDSVAAVEPPEINAPFETALAIADLANDTPRRGAGESTAREAIVTPHVDAAESGAEAAPIVSDVPARGPEIADAAQEMPGAPGAALALKAGVVLPDADTYVVSRNGSLALWSASGPDAAKLDVLTASPSSVSVWASEGALSTDAPATETAGIVLAAFGGIEPAFIVVPSLDAPAPTQPAALGTQTPPAPLDLPPFTAAEDAAIRVVLHIPEQVGDARVEEYRTAAEAAGLTVDSLVRTPFSVSGTNVRYYHGEDIAAAEALAEALGARARDFTSFEPAPDPGLVEIYAEGLAAPRPAVQPRPPAPSVVAAEQPRRYRIIRIKKPRRSFSPFSRSRNDNDDSGSSVQVVTVPSPTTPGTTITDLIAAASNNGGGTGSTGGTTGTTGATTGSTSGTTGGTTGTTGSTSGTTGTTGGTTGTTGSTGGTTGATGGTTGTTGGTTGSTGSTTGSTSGTGGSTGSTSGSTGSTSGTSSNSGSGSGTTSGSSGGSPSGGSSTSGGSTSSGGTSTGGGATTSN